MKNLSDSRTVPHKGKSLLINRRLQRSQSINADTVLIVNPNSSGGLTGKNWEDLFLKIKTIFGGKIQVAFTKKPDDGTALTRDFLRRGVKKIVAIGGDGTINEVVNGFFEEPIGIYRSKDVGTAGLKILKPINSKAIFGFLPCGTRNVLARSLNLSGEIIQCCQTFVEGKPKKIDVISAAVTNPKDRLTTISRVFLNAAEIGVAAEIIDRSKKVRKEVKSRLVSTAASIIATLPTYESNLCEISLDNGRENIITKMTMGVVSNGKFLGGGFKVAPQADASDGLLDVIILKNSGSFKMLDKFLNMRDGDYRDERDIFYIQAKNVSIKSKEKDVTVTVDGETVGILPATFQVLQNALTIMV